MGNTGFSILTDFFFPFTINAKFLTILYLDYPVSSIFWEKYRPCILCFTQLLV